MRKYGFKLFSTNRKTTGVYDEAAAFVRANNRKCL